MWRFLNRVCDVFCWIAMAAIIFAFFLALFGLVFGVLSHTLH